jgi:hypothetical protein
MKSYCWWIDSEVKVGFLIVIGDPRFYFANFVRRKVTEIPANLIGMEGGQSPKGVGVEVLEEGDGVHV